jgi:effector-binding domain-containing protein
VQAEIRDVPEVPTICARASCTYRELERWIADNGHEPAGPPRDLYVDDPGTVAPDAVRTEVYWPIN